MSPNRIDSLCEFLVHAQTDFRVFEMGRTLRLIDTQAFLDTENALIPVTNPRQQKAWYAIVFWQALPKPVALTETSPYIWFVSFPIDEQSKLVTASRDHFLQTVIEALQRDPLLKEPLPDNPYVFKPTETQQGQLLGMARHLGLYPRGDYVHSAVSYAMSPDQYDWQSLVTQSIFDDAYIIGSHGETCDGITENWHKLAEPFKRQLLIALEPVELAPNMEAFLSRQFLNSDVTEEKALCLRALSRKTHTLELTQIIAQYLTKEGDISLDMLSVIAGRHANQLTPGLIQLFLSRCALLDENNNASGEVLSGFYADLVYIPELRHHVLNVARNARKQQ